MRSLGLPFPLPGGLAWAYHRPSVIRAAYQRNGATSGQSSGLINASLP